MSNQAMTKLAAEFYERGRRAALIEAGLLKVANKGFNRGFYGSLLGLSAAQLALAKLLQGGPALRMRSASQSSTNLLKRSGLALTLL